MDYIKSPIRLFVDFFIRFLSNSLIIIYRTRSAIKLLGSAILKNFAEIRIEYQALYGGQSASRRHTMTKIDYVPGAVVLKNPLSCRGSR